HEPVGRKEPWYNLGYRPVRAQTVLTTIESPPRVVTRDLARQQRECFARDVGRIGENGIKPTRYRGGPITDEEARPISKTEQERTHPADLLLVQHAVGVSKKIGGRYCESFRNQSTGLAPAIHKTGCRQRCCGCCDKQTARFHHRVSTAASFAA